MQSDRCTFEGRTSWMGQVGNRCNNMRLFVPKLLVEEEGHKLSDKLQERGPQALSDADCDDFAKGVINMGQRVPWAGHITEAARVLGGLAATGQIDKRNTLIRAHIEKRLAESLLTALETSERPTCRRFGGVVKRVSGII